MTHNFWQGSKARLRALEPRDWEVFHAFDADTEVARLCDQVHFPRSSEGTQAWAKEEATAKPGSDAFRWVIENEAGVIVGTINTFGCDRRTGAFKYGLAIAREHWRRGYAREAICIVLRYYFRELRYQKVNVHIYDFNEASIKLHEKLGFQHEGRLRRMLYADGAFHDEIHMGLTAEEFEARWNDFSSKA